jgi:hypothetical protein
MKFQLGDKVKFLNTTGGGVVSKIISPTLVNVMIEDGFEIPTLTSEIVRVAPQGKAERMFDEEFQVPGSRVPNAGKSNQAIPISRKESTGTSIPKTLEPGTLEPGTIDPGDRQTPLGNYAFLAKNTPGVYLAFVPHDQKWLVTGMVEVYLVNHTQSDVLYTFFLEGEKSLLGKDYDVLFRQNKILIDTIDRDELLKWTKGLVQLLLFDENPEKIYMPVSSEIDISASRFNDEKNYKNSQFMEERLLLVSVAQVAGLSSLVNREESKIDEEVLIRQKAKEVRPGSLIDKHQTGPREAVVDLHIGELLEDFSHLTPHEMLKYQMDYFEKCIESAAERNFRKVTFIHGVGNGSLKSAIIRRVQEYDHAESHLASLEKFGVGAIDVNIKPLK